MNKDKTSTSEASTSTSLNEPASKSAVSVLDPGDSLSSTGVPISLDRIPNPRVHPRIFIERDYSNMGVRFSTEIPNGLEQYIEPLVFKKMIEEINEKFESAEKCGPRSFLETISTVLTFNLISLCTRTYYEKTLDKVNKLIDAKNQVVLKHRGLRMISPVNHGLRMIEIVVIDHEFRHGVGVESEASVSS